METICIALQGRDNFFRRYREKVQHNGFYNEAIRSRVMVLNLYDLTDKFKLKSHTFSKHRHRHPRGFCPWEWQRVLKNSIENFIGPEINWIVLTFPHDPTVGIVFKHKQVSRDQIPMNFIYLHSPDSQIRSIMKSKRGRAFWHNSSNYPKVVVNTRLICQGEEKGCRIPWSLITIMKQENLLQIESLLFQFHFVSITSGFSTFRTVFILSSDSMEISFVMIY